MANLSIFVLLKNIDLRERVCVEGSLVESLSDHTDRSECLVSATQPASQINVEYLLFVHTLKTFNFYIYKFVQIFAREARELTRKLPAGEALAM